MSASAVFRTASNTSGRSPARSRSMSGRAWCGRSTLCSIVDRRHSDSKVPHQNSLLPIFGALQARELESVPHATHMQGIPVRSTCQANEVAWVPGAHSQKLVAWLHSPQPRKSAAPRAPPSAAPTARPRPPGPPRMRVALRAPPAGGPQAQRRPCRWACCPVCWRASPLQASLHAWQSTVLRFRAKSRPQVHMSGRQAGESFTQQSSWGPGSMLVCRIGAWGCSQKTAACAVALPGTAATLALAPGLPFVPALPAGFAFGCGDGGGGTRGASAGPTMLRDPPASSAGKSGNAPVSGSRFSMNHALTCAAERLACMAQAEGTHALATLHDLSNLAPQASLQAAALQACRLIP